MSRSWRAAAPAAPTPPRASHPGYGSCRGMESSGPPPLHPRTFPHPLEILGARPPPPRIPTAPTAATTRDIRGKDKKRGTKPTTSTNMSRRSSLRSDGWSPSIGTGGRFRRNPQQTTNPAFAIHCRRPSSRWTTGRGAPIYSIASTTKAISPRVPRCSQATTRFGLGSSPYPKWLRASRHSILERVSIPPRSHGQPRSLPGF